MSHGAGTRSNKVLPVPESIDSSGIPRELPHADTNEHGANTTPAVDNRATLNPPSKDMNFKQGKHQNPKQSSRQLNQDQSY